MSLREQLLGASRKASEVLSDFGARKRVHDGNRSRVDPIALAEHAGVAVMLQEMQHLLGAFLREARPGILVNSDRPVGMVHMTGAHELGHYFLGHVTTADEHIDYDDAADAREQEANQFAYSLLSPRWLVAHAMAVKGWSAADLTRPNVVYQLSLRLGMSFTAMVWALVRIRLLNPVVATAMAKRQPKTLKEAALPPGVSAPTNADVWVLDPRDKDWIVEPRATDRFIVRLPSHAAAGYLWTSDQIRGEGFFLKPVLEDSRQRGHRVEPPLVGGRRVDSYVLDAASQTPSEREAQMRLREGQPWDMASMPCHAMPCHAKPPSLRQGLRCAVRDHQNFQNERLRGASSSEVLNVVALPTRR